VYEVEITPERPRHLDRLPPTVRAAVIETILGSIAENPQRAGKPLEAVEDEVEAELELFGVVVASRAELGHDLGQVRVPPAGASPEGG